MKRDGTSRLSHAGEHALAQYARYLRDEQDLSPTTLRNYLSDLRHFASWCERSWAEGQEEDPMCNSFSQLTH